MNDKSKFIGIETQVETILSRAEKDIKKLEESKKNLSGGIAPVLALSGEPNKHPVQKSKEIEGINNDILNIRVQAYKEIEETAKQLPKDRYEKIIQDTQQRLNIEKEEVHKTEKGNEQSRESKFLQSLSYSKFMNKDSDRSGKEKNNEKDDKERE